MSLSWTRQAPILTVLIKLGAITREPGWLGLARCFGIEEPFGLVPPGLHELFRFAVVGDGQLHDGGLFGRDRAVDKLAPLHVPPLEVRPMASTRVIGAATARLAADLRTL